MQTKLLNKQIKTNSQWTSYSAIVPKKEQLKFILALSQMLDLSVPEAIEIEFKYWTFKNENNNYLNDIYELIKQVSDFDLQLLDWFALIKHIDFMIQLSMLNEGGILKSDLYNKINFEMLENYGKFVKSIRITNDLNEKIKSFLRVF